MAQRIYFLYDPREGAGAEPRYVGKTSNTIARRLTEHLHLAKTGDHTYRSRWIASILALGVRPAIAFIEDEVPDELIDEREIHWISALRENGARLTNLTDGGDGTSGRVMSEDKRQRVIQMQTEKWADPDRRAERLDAIRNSDRWTREAKQAQGLQMKEFWSDPNFRRRTQEGMRRAWADPEYRNVMLDLAAKRWTNPECLRLGSLARGILLAREFPGRTDSSDLDCRGIGPHSAPDPQGRHLCPGRGKRLIRIKMKPSVP